MVRHKKKKNSIIISIGILPTEYVVYGATCNWWGRHYLCCSAPLHAVSASLVNLSSVVRRTAIHKNTRVSININSIAMAEEYLYGNYWTEGLQHLIKILIFHIIVLLTPGILCIFLGRGRRPLYRPLWTFHCRMIFITSFFITELNCFFEFEFILIRNFSYFIPASTLEGANSCEVWDPEHKNDDAEGANQHFGVDQKLIIKMVCRVFLFFLILFTWTLSETFLYYFSM